MTSIILVSFIIAREVESRVPWYLKTRPVKWATLRIECRRGTSFVWRSGLDTTFSLRDYDHFQFSWKLEGVEQGWSKTLIFRVDDSPTDFHLLLRPQAAEVTSAHVDARQDDQYGRFDAADWFTADTRLQRRMILLREGALVVCDRVQPGPTADGWQAGPLWHIRTEPQAGENWYNAPGREELLVWLGPAPAEVAACKPRCSGPGRSPLQFSPKRR